MGLKQLELQRLRDLQTELARVAAKALCSAKQGVESGSLTFNSLAAERLLDAGWLAGPVADVRESFAEMTSIDELRGVDFYARIRLIRRALDPAPDRWMAAESKRAGLTGVLGVWRAARFEVARMLIRELEDRGREAGKKWRADADARGMLPQAIIAEVLRFRFRTKKLFFIACLRRLGIGSLNSNAPLEAAMIQLIDGGVAHGQC